MTAMTDLMNFRREGSEHIDDLITRFDILRQRANAQGQLVVSIQGLVWIPLRACEVNDTQLMQVLAPTHGLLPATNLEYDHMKLLLRRMGHIIEGSPLNLAAQLRRQHPSTRHGAPTYLANEVPAEQAGNPWAAAFASVPGGNASAYPTVSAPAPAPAPPSYNT